MELYLFIKRKAGKTWPLTEEITVKFFFSNSFVLILDFSWHTYHSIRADSRFATSQWETSLQSNTVSHWLGANLESTLVLFYKGKKMSSPCRIGSSNGSTLDHCSDTGINSVFNFKSTIHKHNFNPPYSTLSFNKTGNTVSYQSYKICNSLLTSISPSILDPFHQYSFSIRRKIKSKFHFSLIQIFNIVFPTNFCTSHDSCAVVACAKICRDLITGTWITTKKFIYLKSWENKMSVEWTCSLSSWNGLPRSLKLTI